MKTDIRYFGAAPVHVTQPQHIASCFVRPKAGIQATGVSKAPA